LKPDSLLAARIGMRFSEPRTRLRICIRGGAEGAHEIVRNSPLKAGLARSTRPLMTLDALKSANLQGYRTNFSDSWLGTAT